MDGTNTAVDTALFPSTFSILNTSNSVGKMFGVAWTGDIDSLGAYNLSVVVTNAETGDVAEEFDVEFTQGTSFDVIDSTSEPATPVFSRAVFANDGTRIALSFNSPTDRNGSLSSAPFACSRMFTFDNVDIARCSWVDAATIALYPGTGSSLSVGSAIALFEGSVKAACTTVGATCSSWAHTASRTVVVAAPVSPTVPNVVLSFPSSLGDCDNLVIDLSSSIGDGGRSWQSVEFTVDSTAPNVSLVEDFLNSAYVMSPPTPVSHELLEVGYKYFITVTMCNFLGGCGQSSRISVNIVSFAIPTTNIRGALVRTIARKNAVLLNSDAFITSCDGGSSTKSYANLVYSWKISVDGVQRFDLVSSSVDSRKFALPAFTLSVGTLYVVQLSVLSTVSGKASKASTEVFVKSGSVVAIIQGGSRQAVQQGGAALILDASRSFDENFNPVEAANSANPLLFSWECTQIAPSFSSTCGVGVSGGVSSSTLTVTALGGAETSSLVVVTVTESAVSTNSGSARSADAAVEVVTIPAEAPVVTIASALAGKLNVDNKLKLSGSVTAAGNGTAVWSVSDSAISLASVLLTPINNSIVVPSGDSGSVTSLYFSLSSFSLPARSTLTFTLTCVLVSGASSSSSIDIRTNGAPVPGSFRVSPSSGQALNTSFVFAASSWTDEDTPLSYGFSFVDSTSGNSMTIQAKSEVSYGSSTLPPGIETSGFAVSCTIIVYDALSASTTADTTVEVTELRVDAAELTNMVSAQLSAGAGNADATMQVLATASSFLNVVNCSLAPNCMGLHRGNCAQTPHTCGVCFPGFTGEEGEANSRCMAASAAGAMNNRRALTGSRCGSDDDCDVWSVCDGTGTCSRLPKMCVDSGCSGRGTCIFEEVDSGTLVDDCRQGDISCLAVCSCVSGYAGSACAITAEDLESMQLLRSGMISSLGDLTESENPSSDNLASWSNSLSGLTQIADEVSGSAVDSISKIATAIVTNAAASDSIVVGDIGGVIGALDVITRALAGNTTFRRRLAAGDTSDDTVSSVVNLLQSYGAMASADMVPGQPSADSIMSNFRVSSIAVSGDSATVSTPLSFAETAKNIQPMDVELPSSSSGGVLETSSVVMGSSMFNNSEFDSNPLFFSLSAAPCNAQDAACRLVVTLQNNVPVDVDSADYSTPRQEFSTACVVDEVQNVTYMCDNGMSVTGSCNGTATGNITSYCPKMHQVSVCNSLGNNDEAVSNACEVVEFTADYITCSCPLATSSSSGGRRLTASNGTVNVNMVSMLSTVTDNFASTFVSAKDITGTALVKSIAVVATIGLLGLFAVLGVFVGFRVDAADHLSLHPNSGKGKASRVAVKAQNRKKMIADQLVKVKRNLTVEEEFIENSLPDAMKTQSFSEKLSLEVKSSHKWVGVIFHYSPHFPRALRILMLVTGVFTMLFMQAILYPIAHPDDGTCPRYHTEQECLAESSALGGGPKCRFKVDDTTGSSHCSYNPPGDSLMTVVFMAVIAGIIAAPLHLFADWVILNVLVAPVVTNKVEDVADTIEDSVAAYKKDTSNRQGTVSVAVDGGRRSSTTGPRASVTSRLSLASLFGGKKDILETTLNEDLTDLIKNIQLHRNSLDKAFQRVEFDDLWGIHSESGHFRSDPEQLSLMEKLQGKKNDVHSLVLADLSEVRKAATREIEYMSASNVTKAEKGKRLIRLFQQDMMPGLSGKVLETTGSQDKSVKPTPRPVWQHAVGWAIIVGMDTVMLFYIFLFSIQQSNEQQDAWLKSFLVFIFMDIVFVATLIVYVKKIWIPSFAMKDLYKIRDRMMETIRSGLNKRNGDGSEEEDEVFDATEYLYVATRVAKKFPKLKESKIILNFKTPWPKRSYQRVRLATKDYNSKFKAITSGLSTVAMALFSTYIELPSSVQDMGLQSVTSTVFGGFMIAFSYLYAISPLVAIAPLIVVVVSVHFIILWSSSKANAQLRSQSLQKKQKAIQRLAQVRPLAVPTNNAATDAAVAAAPDATVTKGPPKTNKESIMMGGSTLDKLTALQKRHRGASDELDALNEAGPPAGEEEEEEGGVDDFADIEAWIAAERLAAEDAFAASDSSVSLHYDSGDSDGGNDDRLSSEEEEVDDNFEYPSSDYWDDEEDESQGHENIILELAVDENEEDDRYCQ